MDLGDIYSNNVNKSSIGMTGSLGNLPTRERDPKSLELENNVFNKMQEVASPPTNPIEKQNVPVVSVQHVGFEQALKELSNGVESLDNKS
jgi:hypothetical protein